MTLHRASFAGGMDRAHFGEFGQTVQHVTDLIAFHLANGGMHPDQRAGGNCEQQHEAALPDAGQIIQGAERDGQDEAAKAADHADKAADRADILWIIDRDMLEDRSLAQAHEKAEHEDQDDKGHRTGRQPETDRPVDAINHIGRRRIRQQEGGDDRYQERPVHDLAGTDLVRQMAAIDPEQRRRHRIGCGDHARSLQIEPIDTDQIARQPQRQADKGAENKEIIQRKTPDLHIAQRRELFGKAARCGSARAAFGQVGFVPGRHEEQDGHDNQRAGPDARHTFPAQRPHHRRREELGDSGADITGAKDAQRGALPLRRIEFGDIGHADGKAAPRNAHPERRHQKLDIGRCVREQPGGERRGQHDDDLYPAAAHLIGPHTEHEADQRAGQDRCCNQQAELGFVEAKIFLDLDAKDRKYRPGGKADGEGRRRHAKCHTGAGDCSADGLCRGGTVGRAGHDVL